MSLNINGAKISDNYAGNSGGGIYISKVHLFYDVKLHLNSGIVANNSSGYMGGGIFVTTADNATTYSDEKYPNHNTLTEVNVGSEGNSLIISNNKTERHAGGGIALNGAKIIMTNGTITGNTAATYGGGVYVGDNEWGADITIKGGVISENLAKDGGGCAVQANNFKIVEATIEGGVINNNQATNNGGAIYVEEGDLHIYGDCKIQEGTAKFGGAVCVSGGNVDITGGTIINSQATSGRWCLYFKW